MNDTQQNDKIQIAKIPTGEKEAEALEPGGKYSKTILEGKVDDAEKKIGFIIKDIEFIRKENERVWALVSFTVIGIVAGTVVVILTATLGVVIDFIARIVDYFFGPSLIF